MAGADPRTWATGDVMTYTLLNTEIRTNHRSACWLIDTLAYNPAATSVTTTGAAASLDATNIAISFAIPQSGRILSVFSAYAAAATAGQGLSWAETNLAGSPISNWITVTKNTTARRCTLSHYIALGVAGDHAHLKMMAWTDPPSLFTAGGGTTSFGGTFGPAIWDIWAVG